MKKQNGEKIQIFFAIIKRKTCVYALFKSIYLTDDQSQPDFLRAWSKMFVQFIKIEYCPEKYQAF